MNKEMICKKVRKIVRKLVRKIVWKVRREFYGKISTLIYNYKLHWRYRIRHLMFGEIFLCLQERGAENE